MESRNVGRRDERLLVQGTQARAPGSMEGRALSRPATTKRGSPKDGIPSAPSFQHSRIPAFQ